MMELDLRSDTVTRPSAEMLEAMCHAQTGDDVYGEDPSVNALESLAADMSGKEAALFVPSGTQGNLLALLTHCQRGEEYIAGQQAHTYRFEAGGGAVLGGIQPQPIPFNEAGELPLEDVESVIKPDDFHFARTRLLCLENTQAGKVLSLEYLKDAAALARRYGLGLHLDGARAFNAAVKLGIEIKEICQYFDTVSICLSKGLAAPVGSVLVGSQELIVRARRWRKMLGGGMRQAGILAAGGLYALTHNVTRLADDHRRAFLLADFLATLPGLEPISPPQTNMVLLAVDGPRFETLKQFLAAHQVRISTSRLVLHRDIDDGGLARIMDLFAEFSAVHTPGAG